MTRMDTVQICASRSNGYSSSSNLISPKSSPLPHLSPISLNSTSMPNPNQSPNLPLESEPTSLDRSLTEPILHHSSLKELCTEFHVLAVDDSNIERKVIETLLKKQAYKVTTAESAIHAMKILGLDSDAPSSPKRFNMIITDYSMPGMNGNELLRKIKDAASLRATPVIVMSSEDILSRKKKCLEDGAEEFLLKPIRMNDLMRIIHLANQGTSISNLDLSGDSFCKSDFVCEAAASPSPPSSSALSLEIVISEAANEGSKQFVKNNIPNARSNLGRYRTSKRSKNSNDERDELKRSRNKLTRFSSI